MDYAPALQLYLSNCHGFPVAKAEEPIQTLAAAGKPILVYVHGRGDEPEKSLNGQHIVKRLESYGDVSVLMFNWDSKGILLDRRKPLSHVPEAAENLRQLLVAFEKWQNENASPGLSLLVHSMGNVVLQRLAELGGFASANPLFHNVLCSESDADAQGHAAWLETVASRNTILVTTNANDFTLRSAVSGRNMATNPPLGLGLMIDRYASNAIYVDLTDRIKKKAHRVFMPRAMNFNFHWCRAVRASLRSEQIDMSDLEVRAGNRWTIKAGHDAAHECFAGSAAEGDESNDD